MYALLDHMFSLPARWQWVELAWLLGLAYHGYQMYKKDGWFGTPITAGAMFWEVPLLAVTSVFLTTEFQLEGLFVIMKYHFLKEWWKHEKLFLSSSILAVSTFFFLLVVFT
jgi:hypothetical protein